MRSWVLGVAFILGGCGLAAAITMGTPGRIDVLVPHSYGGGACLDWRQYDLSGNSQGEVRLLATWFGDDMAPIYGVEAYGFDGYKVNVAYLLTKSDMADVRMQVFNKDGSKRGVMNVLEADSADGYRKGYTDLDIAPAGLWNGTGMFMALTGVNAAGHSTVFLSQYQGVTRQRQTVLKEYESDIGLKGIAVADFDNDGNPDVLVGRMVGTAAQISRLEFDKDGNLLGETDDILTLALWDDMALHGIDLADVDGDGKLDLLILTSQPSWGCNSAVWKYKGDGLGGFTANGYLIDFSGGYGLYWQGVSVIPGLPWASQGHQLLVRDGLQLQAQVFPRSEDIQQEVGLNLDRFAESQFTAANFQWNVYSNLYLQDPATCPYWGRWAGYGDGYVTPGEQPFLSKLIGIQYGDGQDLNDPAHRQLLKSWFDGMHVQFPDAMVYTDQFGSQFSFADMQAYMADAHPDMVMFTTFPFNGNVTGGSPTALYRDMQKYRLLGLGGNDGTGAIPIPYALYTQTYTRNGHEASESEMRLNEFAAWAFGYKLISAFVYNDIYSNSEAIESILFDGKGDGTPTEKFYQLAESNRQSRNLGPALVRLLSTDVRLVMGQHETGDTNDVPEGITVGLAGTDAYITGITATNLGMKNNGLPGDIVVGFFKPLHEMLDGDQYSNQKYFMVINGLSDGNGSAAETRQQIRIDFDFGSSGITGLERLGRNTGYVATVPLVHDGGSLYHLDLVLDGGTGDLFKFNTGAPFVGASYCPGDANRDGLVTFEDFCALQNHYGQSPTGDAWSQGDFNGDGQVSFADFSILQNHYNQFAANAEAANGETVAGMPCSGLGLIFLALVGLEALLFRYRE